MTWVFQQAKAEGGKEEIYLTKKCTIFLEIPGVPARLLDNDYGGIPCITIAIFVLSNDT